MHTFMGLVVIYTAWFILLVGYVWVECKKSTEDIEEV